MGNDARNAHPQTVFQGDNGGSLHTGQSLHIGADAAGIQMTQVCFQGLSSIIKIMVTQGDKIVPGQIHDPGRNFGALGGVSE